MSATTRLGLPMLTAGQAQKEITHNEALQTLDFITAACVEEPPRSDPPATPVTGACYIVGTSPTGVWVGKPANLACYSAGGYRFIPPFEGLSVLMRSTGTLAVYRQGAWDLGSVMGARLVVDGQQVVGARATAIPMVTGGTVIDVQCRNGLALVLAAMRQHGLIAS